MNARVDVPSFGAFLELVSRQRFLIASNHWFGSMGHMAQELDFLLRARRQRLMPDGRACLLVLRDEPLSNAYAAHFPDLLPPFARSTQIWEWAHEAVRAMPEIAFNIGTSHWSWERPVDDPGHTARIWENRLEFIVSQRAFRARVRRNHALRAATSDWYPFRRELAPSPALARFLDAFGARPLALVHVRQSVVNSTAQVTDPATYLPMLALIRDLGWQPVFVGREIMPDAFRALGVADYAGSGLATPADDLVLFNSARVAITSGSGIAHPFEIMDVPLVYTNGWHVDHLCAARRCVVVPTTMRERASDRPLSIVEQITLHKRMPDGAFYSFPHETHVPEQSTAEHIREAVEEVLKLGPPGTEPPPPNALQIRFSRLDPESPFAAGRARVGAAWAAAFEHRFGDVA